MDGPLREDKNWRSQSQTSHKPIRPVSKSLESTRKELQEVKRSLGGAVDWALSAGTLGKSKGEPSQEHIWAAQLHGSGRRHTWEGRRGTRKLSCKGKRQKMQKWEQGKPEIKRSDMVGRWDWGKDSDCHPKSEGKVKGRPQSGGGLLFSFFLAGAADCS